MAATLELHPPVWRSGVRCCAPPSGPRSRGVHLVESGRILSLVSARRARSPIVTTLPGCFDVDVLAQAARWVVGGEPDLPCGQGSRRRVRCDQGQEQAGSGLDGPQRCRRDQGHHDPADRDHPQGPPRGARCSRRGHPEVYGPSRRLHAPSLISTPTVPAGPSQLKTGSTPGSPPDPSSETAGRQDRCDLVSAASSVHGRPR